MRWFGWTILDRMRLWSGGRTVILRRRSGRNLLRGMIRGGRGRRRGISASSSETFTGGMMAGEGRSRVTLHVVSSLDGFIARRDNSVSWMDGQKKVYEAGVS